jgi:chromosome segregation ATPase
VSIASPFLKIRSDLTTVQDDNKALTSSIAQHSCQITELTAKLSSFTTTVQNTSDDCGKKVALLIEKDQKNEFKIARLQSTIFDLTDKQKALTSVCNVVIAENEVLTDRLTASEEKFNSHVASYKQEIIKIYTMIAGQQQQTTTIREFDSISSKGKYHIYYILKVVLVLML